MNTTTTKIAGEAMQITDEQWYDLAQRHANSDWNSDGYLAAIKAVCADYSLLASKGAVPQLRDKLERIAQDAHAAHATGGERHMEITLGEIADRLLEIVVAMTGVADTTAPAQADEAVTLPPLPAPLEIDWPELHSHALGCGVEDRSLRDRYECAEYGWQVGVDRAAECVPEEIFTAEQMQEYARQAIDAARAKDSK